MLYGIIKNLIEHNYYEREDMTNKLNVFMLVNQIAQEQYLELLAMINPVEHEIKEEVKDDKVTNETTEKNTTLDNSDKTEEIKTEVSTQ